MFYVYAYIRKSDNTPYYIGKGKNNRFAGIHNVSVPKDRTKIIFLETNLSEIGALAIERRMIAWYGRKDIGTGILHNRTDGGEGAEGAIRTAETKRKMSESMTGKKKLPRSEQHRKNISLSKIGNIPWNKGIKTGPESEETRKKKSAAGKCRTRSARVKTFSQEYKDAQSLRMTEWWKNRKEQKHV